MDAPDTGQGLHFVKVINRNGFALPEDYFDGVRYSFPPNEPQSIPADAATHFFGYPGDRDEMFQHTTRRYGWNTPAHIMAGPDGKSDAEKFFGKLEFKPVIYELVEKADADPTAPIAADLAGDDEPQRAVLTPTEALAPVAEPEARGRRNRRPPARQPRRFEEGAAAKGAAE